MSSRSGGFADALPVRVWAPHAERVEVAVAGSEGGGGERRAMEPEAGGWWSLPGGLPEGADYGFVLDGEGPFPDPRSRWQPEGVEGPSRVLDPRALRPSADGWRGFHLPSAVLYELHVGTFSAAGTFDGAIAHLDELVELGVTAIELMPVASFPGERGWGYDGVALWAPQEAYGGPAGLARLVDAAHARGLGVVLDVVYNHLGPSGNHLGRFGPYFTGCYTTPWGDAVNFDQGGCDEVRAFVIDNALSWMRDYRIDGLRLDAVHAILDRSAVHVLEELSERTAALEAEVGRPLWLIAESDLNDPRLLRSREAGGYGIHAQWSDDFHHALHAALTGEGFGYYHDFGRLEDVATALRRGWVYDGRRSPHRERRHGRPLEGVGGERLLGYLQNHDQVGNRARGERIAHLVGSELARVGAALVLTAPFVPLLFMGEEWGASAPFQYFTDHHDPALGRAVSEGRRREFKDFGWDPARVPDPQDPATFERSRLDRDEREREPHRSLLAWYRALIRLRREVPDLGAGRLGEVRARADEEARTLVVERGRATVVANLADEPRTVAAAGALRLASRDGVEVGEGRVALPPASVAILLS